MMVMMIAITPSLNASSRPLFMESQKLVGLHAQSPLRVGQAIGERSSVSASRWGPSMGWRKKAEGERLE